MPCIEQNISMPHLFYTPSFRLSKLAGGRYGVGHTAWRHPGDMRGSVVGKKGRFRGPRYREEVVFKT